MACGRTEDKEYIFKTQVVRKWGHTGKEIAAKIFPEIGHLLKSWTGNDGTCYDVLNPHCTF